MKLIKVIPIIRFAYEKRLQFHACSDTIIPVGRGRKNAPAKEVLHMLFELLGVNPHGYNRYAVLLAIGCSNGAAKGSLRLTIDEENTEDEIETIAKEVTSAVSLLRKINRL